MELSIPEIVPVIARIAIGLVLIFAGVAKLRSQTWAVLAVEMGTPKSVVITLPAIETLLGLALVMQLAGNVLSIIAAVMFLVFTAVVISRYRSGSQAPCNCFGDKGDPVTKMTIARNFLLVTLALIGAM